MPERPHSTHSCSRCGGRGGPGHGCDRSWLLLFGVRVARSGFERSAGGLSNAYWSLYWTWKGDTHVFNPRLSFGAHRNLSRMGRRERRERELRGRICDECDEPIAWCSCVQATP